MTILCYHSVEPDWESPLAVRPEAFAQQMAWLSRSRHVLPLAEALPRLDARMRLPSGTVALTFDDGFAALHEHVLPVLTRLRLPATVFLVAQTLTPAGRPVDWVKGAGTARLTTLTCDQVLEMQDAGVDFQSHSWAHHDLTDLSYEECVRDLRASREFLSDLLGREVTQLAYPRGLHDAGVRKAAAAAGYTHAFALPETAEVPGPYAVPRVGIWRGNGLLAVRVKEARPYLPLRTSDPVARSARRVKAVVGKVRART
ncbi:Polysaccharide deacetylase [Blastococcus sp. DSM 46786]|uniref:polysaccharide deacetylase family protein n=1 Tax=Blastococcus sp. DSM 46786 TaxID=1798227 RepID=UPI0008B8418A|nr:polysaccharide deacetylase family protein [Blastococcus sp. DSM 46786]SEK38050.1 Polysaccharide deacetylase [Blastococcus sp. DSM 46786]